MCESQGKSHSALGRCVDPTVLLRVVTIRTYTGLFEMIVGVLTTCRKQYT